MRRSPGGQARLAARGAAGIRRRERNPQRARRVAALGPAAGRRAEAEQECAQRPGTERKLAANPRQRAAQQADRDDAEREARVELDHGAQLRAAGLGVERERVDPARPVVARFARRPRDRHRRLAQRLFVAAARAHAAPAVHEAPVSAVEPGALDEQLGRPEQHELPIAADPQLRAQVAAALEPGLEQRAARAHEAREAPARLGDAAREARDAPAAARAEARLEGEAPARPSGPAREPRLDLPHRALRLAQLVGLEHRDAALQLGRDQPLCDRDAMRERLVVYGLDHLGGRAQQRAPRLRGEAQRARRVQPGDGATRHVELREDRRRVAIAEGLGPERVVRGRRVAEAARAARKQQPPELRGTALDDRARRPRALRLLALRPVGGRVPTRTLLGAEVRDQQDFSLHRGSLGDRDAAPARSGPRARTR